MGVVIDKYNMEIINNEKDIGNNTLVICLIYSFKKLSNISYPYSLIIDSG